MRTWSWSILVPVDIYRTEWTENSRVNFADQECASILDQSRADAPHSRDGAPEQLLR